MGLAAVLGQDRVVDAIRRSIAANRVAHAYLFEGPAGCGRRTTALAMIQALFCIQPVDGDACGQCRSCRKLDSGNHADLHILEPLPDKRDISIEQVRELQQVLSLRPYEATRKACLIYPAERMTVGAANALLKTLEEPPGHAVMILLATQTDMLLSTVRSRCQHLRFSPLDDGIVARLLERQGMESGLATALAPLAQGSMKRAKDIDGEEDARQRSEMLTVLVNADPGRIASIFDTSETIAGNREETTGLFDLLISLIRDMLLLRTTGADGVINLPLLDSLAVEASRFSATAIMDVLQLAIETRRAVQGNVNAKLALDRFLLCYGSLRKA